MNGASGLSSETDNSEPDNTSRDNSSGEETVIVQHDSRGSPPFVSCQIRESGESVVTKEKTNTYLEKEIAFSIGCRHFFLLSVEFLFFCSCNNGDRIPKAL